MKLKQKEKKKNKKAKKVRCLECGGFGYIPSLAKECLLCYGRGYTSLK